MTKATDERPERGAIADASAWLARLRSDECSPADRRAFSAWLDGAAEHRAAFERVTLLFDSVGGVEDRWPREHPQQDQQPEPVAPSRRLFLAGAGAAVVGTGAVSWQAAVAGTTRTGFGERRSITLEDGTRVLLDAETQVRAPWLRTRRIDLEHGRISLAPQAGDHPFEIRAGDHRLHGDAFDGDVRLGSEGLTIGLIAGDLRVEGMDAGTIHLMAGQRLSPDGLVDQPSMEALTAWRHGQLVFADARLSEVCAELNRYDRVRLMPEPGVTAMKVSGTFALGSNARFAEGISELLGVQAARSGDVIRLRATGSES